jgi:hypothetical protein
MAQIHYPKALGESLIHSKISPAFIVEARVLDVNLDRYTLTVAPQFIKHPQSDIPFSVPYQHYENGEGMYFMPEVGSLCWLCYTSQGGKPVVMGWSSAQDETTGSFRAKKMSLNPGDMYLGTRDENFLILRRGGVVQIGGGPLAQRIFLPINNTIKDFCENYGLHSIGGDLEWNVRRSAETTDGRRPASLSIMAKEFSDDPEPIAELEIGSHEGDDTSILSLLIRDSGQTGAAKKVELYLRKNGNVEWVVTGDVSWEVAGKYTVHSKGDASMSTDSTLKLSALQQALLMGKNGVVVDGQSGDVSLRGQKVNIVPQAFVAGAGPSDAVAKATPLMLWLASHVHLLAGALTSPPTVPPPSSIYSKSLFAS